MPKGAVETADSLSSVHAFDRSLKDKHQHLTAGLARATSDIGRATAHSHLPHPKAIIIRRGQEAFEFELASLRTINSKGEFIFLESEISLLKMSMTDAADSGRAEAR